jgi:hypothetical protein
MRWISSNRCTLHTLLDHHPALDIHRVVRIERPAGLDTYTRIYTHTHVMLYIYLDRCSRSILCCTGLLGGVYIYECIGGVEGSNRQVPERVAV